MTSLSPAASTLWSCLARHSPEPGAALLQQGGSDAGPAGVVSISPSKRRAQRDARRGQSPAWGHLCQRGVRGPVCLEPVHPAATPCPSRSHPMSIPQPPRVDAVPSWRQCQDAVGPPQLSQLQVAGNERNPSSLELNPFLICNLFHRDKPKLPNQYVRSILSAWRDAGHGCAALFLR